METQRQIHQLRNAGHLAEISDHGAQILNWTPEGHAPVLWISPAARVDTDPAPRGGIPICLPWFGKAANSPIPLPSTAPAHGIARTSHWSLVETSDTHTRHWLQHAGNNDFPHSFVADLTTTISSDLIVTLNITNTDDHAWEYENAFHTYFFVGDLKDTTVHGVSGARYTSVAKEWHTEHREDVHFVGQTDRVYTASGPLQINDLRLRRTISVTTQGSNSVIIWTPWFDGIDGIADIPNREWNHFVCVEVGNVWNNALSIAPGETQTLSMRLSVNKWNVD